MLRHLPGYAHLQLLILYGHVSVCLLCSIQGTITAPFKTLSTAITATRKHPSGPRTVLLRKGIHYLSDTISLGTTDSNLVIQNYNGEEAWISGVSYRFDFAVYELCCNRMRTGTFHLYKCTRRDVDFPGESSQ